MLSRKDTITAIAEKITIHLFVTMLNPKYRGPKFNFDTFDIEKHVEHTSCMSFVKPLNKQEITSLRKTARFTWEQLIKDSGVLEWIK